MTFSCPQLLWVITGATLSPSPQAAEQRKERNKRRERKDKGKNKRKYNQGRAQPPPSHSDSCLTLSAPPLSALAIPEGLHPTLVSSRNTSSASAASTLHNHLTDGVLGCFHPLDRVPGPILCDSSGEVRKASLPPNLVRNAVGPTVGRLLSQAIHEPVAGHSLVGGDPQDGGLILPSCEASTHLDCYSSPLLARPQGVGHGSADGRLRIGEDGVSLPGLLPRLEGLQHLVNVEDLGVEYLFVAGQVEAPIRPALTGLPSAHRP